MLTEPEILERLAGVEHRLCGGQAKWLYDKICEIPKDGVALEIGAFKGYSAAAMALARVGTGRGIISVDICEEYLSEARQNWRRTGLHNCIESYCAPSSEIGLLSEKHQWPRLRFVFVDGSHEFKDVMADYLNAASLLCPGGRIAFHDVTEAYPDVTRVWNEIASHELENHERCVTISSGTTKL